MSENYRKSLEKKEELFQIEGLELLQELGLKKDMFTSPANKLPLSKKGEKVGGKKVLIIDDDESVSEIMRLTLEEQKLRVFEAIEAQVALTIIRDNPDIDMVFLDLQMPKMNGLQFLKLLRSMKLLEGVPVFITSGHTAEKIVKVAHSLGVTGFLVKPFSPDVLVQKVQALLGPKK